jgi:hypothetical protein
MLAGDHGGSLRAHWRLQSFRKSISKSGECDELRLGGCFVARSERWTGLPIQQEELNPQITFQVNSTLVIHPT